MIKLLESIAWFVSRKSLQILLFAVFANGLLLLGNIFPVFRDTRMKMPGSFTNIHYNANVNIYVAQRCSEHIEVFYP